MDVWGALAEKQYFGVKIERLCSERNSTFLNGFTQAAFVPNITWML